MIAALLMQIDKRRKIFIGLINLSSLLIKNKDVLESSSFPAPNLSNF